MKDEALKKEDEALKTEQEAGTEQTSEAGTGEAEKTEAAAGAGETAEDVPEGAEGDTEQAPAAEKEEKKGFFKKKKDPRDEKIEDLTDRVKRQMAEFENFRRQMGILYCGEYGKRADGTKDDYFFVVYNMHWEPHEFSLPNLPKSRKWYLAMNTDDAAVNGIYPEGEELLLEDQKQYEVPERTILVLIGK